MPLTPEDVSSKRFTPVRLREGYDMGEVDQFLDEVESELTRLTQENADLRSKLSPGQDGDASPVQLNKPEPLTPEPVVTPTPAAPAAPAPSETIKVVTAAEASSAATRLLELATRSADELVAEARAEAEQIVGDARSESERLAADTKEKAERAEADARTRSQALDAETAERRSQLFGDLERDRDHLNGEVENLRAFEREYRSRLKSYFEQQLAALDGTTDSAPSALGGDRPPRKG